MRCILQPVQPLAAGSFSSVAFRCFNHTSSTPQTPYLNHPIARWAQEISCIIGLWMRINIESAVVVFPRPKRRNICCMIERTYTPEVLNREIFDSAATFHTKSWGMNSFKRLRVAGTEPEGDMSRPRQQRTPFQSPAPAKSPSSFRPETVGLWIAHPSPKP